MKVIMNRKYPFFSILLVTALVIIGATAEKYWKLNNQQASEILSLDKQISMEDSIINLQDTLIQKAFDHDNGYHNCDQPWLDDNETTEITDIETRLNSLTSKSE